MTSQYIFDESSLDDCILHPLNLTSKPYWFLTGSTEDAEFPGRPLGPRGGADFSPADLCRLASAPFHHTGFCFQTEMELIALV